MLIPFACYFGYNTGELPYIRFNQKIESEDNA